MVPINYLNEEFVEKLKEICFTMELSLRENRYPHRLEFKKIGLPREYNNMVRTLVEDYQLMKDNREHEFAER